ncbi:MAG: hypothetical protein ACTHVE_04620 [Senegalia sp. (in: firmicutes)]|uniref:hypothetical protein n=2 Tax=Senegalia sp. (in: firmicutes) TaxID=1924098 RepID=UPI003F943ABF
MELDKMNIEKLVDYLTKEVVKNLNLDVEKKEKLLVIDSKKDNKEIKSDKFKIVYLNDLEQLNIDDFSHMIISSFTLNQLANVSMGRSDDQITSIIIEGILKSKSIFILNDGVEYHKFKNTSNENFYNMIEDYEKNIVSFGIKFIDEKDIDLIGGENKGKEKRIYNSDNQDRYEIENKIITESILEKIYRSGHKDISIRNNAIITPLAKDYIRINNINIIKK